MLEGCGWGSLQIISSLFLSPFHSVDFFANVVIPGVYVFRVSDAVSLKPAVGGAYKLYHRILITFPFR
jgi:hypothetical protein